MCIAFTYHTRNRREEQTQERKMGRTQVETNLPCDPSMVQPQAQTFCYPPQPHQTPPHQYYPQPQHVVQASYNTGQQQCSNAAPIPQCHQSGPVPVTQSRRALIPSPTYFHVNSAATEIPMPVPAPSRPPPPFNGAWTTGLFDCMQDPTNALVTGLFPCVTFGQIADVLDNGHTTCATSGILYAFIPCLMSRSYRKKLRQRFGLVEAPASDWIIHSVFEPCALCQEFRELNNRGLNPALGYLGIMNNQQTRHDLSTMVPPKNQMMS